MGARRFLQDVPIRQKLRVIILIISGVTVAGACSAFVTYQWITSHDLRAQTLKVTSEVVGSQAVAAVGSEREGEAAAILGSLQADPLIVMAAIYRRDGRLFARYVREGTPPSIIPPGVGLDGTQFEGGHVLVFHPLTSEGKRAGTIHIRADLADIRHQLWTNISVVVVLMLTAVLAILALTGRLGRHVTLPIQRLAEVVQSVSTKKDYTVRVEGGGQDELGRLMTGFNDMLRAVDEREAALAKARDQLEARVRERTRALEQEIAERKAAQKAIQDKEVKLTEAQKIAQLGSWEWDPAANTVEWSDELFRITGALPTRFEGTFGEALRITHPDDRKRFQDAMEKSRDGREPFQADVRIIRPDGSIRILRMHGKPVLDDAGKTVRLIGTAQDITERKRAESAIQDLNEELRAKVEEVAAANRELEGFSYSVSHDLRAPLRAIHGYSRMLVEDYADKVDGEGRRYLDVIARNTKRMGELIDDLLDFSRLGRQPLHQSPVDMESLVTLVCDEALAAAPGRRLEFRRGALPPAHGDSSMLRVVVTNLVANAVKYTKGRDPAVIEIGSGADGGGTAYFVKDNGVGFEMEYAHKLFGVFQRLHRTEDFEGTGVGLALVQRIIQRHGGRVAAEGRVGSGATFTFVLPGSPEGGGGV